MNNIFYFDIYLLNNTIINYTLLFFSIKTNKLTTYKLRIITVSILAAVVSIPILFFNNYIFTLFKVALPVAMCYYSTSRVSAKQTIKLVITFWMHALILSGVFSVLNSSADFFVIKNTRYGVISYSAICIASLILYILCKYILKLLSRQLLTKNTYKTVEITLNNTNISLIGFCDSGNSLMDKESGLPIFVTDKSSLQYVINLQATPYRYINCTTILGSGEIPVIKPDAIIVDGIKVNALLGVSTHSFCSDYDILLNPIYQTQSAANSFEETENIYV